MDKFFKIAAILTATDQMSSVFASATNKSSESMKQLQNQMQAMRNGSLLIGAGSKGLEMIKATTDAWGEQQTASLNAQAALMTKGGVLDTDMFSNMFHMTEQLSAKYANSTAAYLNMVRVLKTNKIDEKDILGGIGESTAQLADLFDQMDPAAIGQFAARMRNDMGVPVNEMGKMMDAIQRIKNVGIGKTGIETVSEMNEFFSKVGLGLANLHIGGVATGTDMAALGAIFMRRGISGQMVGTNFRRILDGLRDPERSGKANAIASQYGKTLEFFDKAGKFKGIENFVTQLDKLQGLNPAVIAQILKPFSGRQGLSTDFLEFLANEGLSAFKDMKKSMEDQASLSERLTLIMSGLNYQKQVFDSSWETTKAAMGASLNDLLTNVYIALNKIVVAIREFVQEYPHVAKTIMLLATMASVGLIIAGVIVTVSALSAGLQLLGVSAVGAMASFGPVGIAIAALTVIWANWDLEIVKLNGHMVTLGEIIFEALKPLEYGLAVLEQFGYRVPKALLTGDMSQMDYKKNFLYGDIDANNAYYDNYKSPGPKTPTAVSGSMTYAPVITFNGVDANTKAQNQKILADSQKEFDRKMKEYDAQKSRKKY